MGNIGITRKIDNQGRIVIPKEYRNSFKIKKSEQLNVLLTSNGILIRKTKKGCALCEETEHLIEFKKKHVCSSCVERIKNL